MKRSLFLLCVLQELPATLKQLKDQLASMESRSPQQCKKQQQKNKKNKTKVILSQFF